MTATITVLIPVLNRPHRVKPLLESLLASAKFISLDALFLVSPGDDAEIDAIDAFGVVPWECVPWEAGPSDYARKINHGFAETSSEFVLLGADDLIFHHGWAERALACHMETKACVVGTNDGGANRSTATGEHSTHTLVHRDYGGCGVIDEPDVWQLLCEKYDHSFSDTEFVATAKARETWAHAPDCIVEHVHPMTKRVETDSTYLKGQAHFAEDRALFQSRRPLWETL